MDKKDHEMIGMSQNEPIAIQKVRNGYVIHKACFSPDVTPLIPALFVFRNLDELFEWVAEFYR